MGEEVSSEEEDDFLNGDDTSSSAAGSNAAHAAPVAGSAGPAGSGLDSMSLIPPPAIYDKSDEASISRSSSLLKGIPRRRLTAALGKLHKEFEAGYLNELSQRGLLILLWLLTRLRPSARISHLSAWSNVLVSQFKTLSVNPGSPQKSDAPARCAAQLH